MPRMIPTKGAAWNIVNKDGKTMHITLTQRSNGTITIMGSDSVKSMTKYLENGHYNDVHTLCEIHPGGYIKVWDSLCDVAGFIVGHYNKNCGNGTLCSSSIKTKPPRTKITIARKKKTAHVKFE